MKKQLGADEEIVEIAAWLHDIKKIQGVEENHHVYGSEQVVGLLKGMDYDDIRIDKVRRCILTHSSDKTYPPKTLEEKILASADAMAHFNNFSILVYATYKYVEPWGVNENLLNKYKRSFDKMMPEIKKIFKPKYEAIVLLLSK